MPPEPQPTSPSVCDLRARGALVRVGLARRHAYQGLPPWSLVPGPDATARFVPAFVPPTEFPQEPA